MVNPFSRGKYSPNNVNRDEIKVSFRLTLFYWEVFIADGKS